MSQKEATVYCFPEYPVHIIWIEHGSGAVLKEELRRFESDPPPVPPTAGLDVLTHGGH